ncbi:MAG: hypothetical protein JWO36_6182 [Myxococcales bacterium]|nr:hypothetical protein [Myxococcales bacterium]
MIVKDEAHVIERCLSSVKPLIAYWIIVDTGSTDGTQDVIKRVLSDIPGELHERPWKNFAENRTEALQLAKDKADYALVIDADDALELAPGFSLPVLDHGAYAFRVEYADTIYYRPQLLRSSLDWRYEGVVHEAAVSDATCEPAILEGIVYRVHGGGGRSRDPDRYVRDARLLEEALAKEPTNARNVFYLAQSYRDARMPTEALAAYERRATMGGWNEQVYCALLQAAGLHEQLGHARELVWAAYLKAHHSRPTRAEALTELARYCRIGGEMSLAFVFAQAAAEIPQPRDTLFVLESAYRWRALDELAVAAFYTGHLDIAAAASARLLTEGRLPAGEIERVTKNYQLVITQKTDAPARPIIGR